MTEGCRNSDITTGVDRVLDITTRVDRVLDITTGVDRGSLNPYLIFYKILLRWIFDRTTGVDRDFHITTRLDEILISQLELI